MAETNLRLLLWHRDVRSAQAIEKLLLLSVLFEGRKAIDVIEKLLLLSVLFEGRHRSVFECNDDLSGP